MAKDKKAAAQELKKALRELDDLAARQRKAKVREETPEYWAANARVARAEKDASAWQRLKAELGR